MNTSSPNPAILLLSPSSQKGFTVLRGREGEAGSSSEVVILVSSLSSLCPDDSTSTSHHTQVTP